MWPEFNRWHICEAYYLYDILWNSGGLTPYSARLHRIRFEDLNATLENAESEVKAIYGRVVLRHNRLYIGYERLHRRHPDRFPQWPGTRHMKGGAWEWLRSRGWLDAVHAVAPYVE